MTISLKAQEIKRYSWTARIGDWLNSLDIRLYFLFIFIYHLLVIFQGLDFNDEGFHLAFYQQIFSDPESVQYAFWGWLTGMVGGIFLKLFPFLGMLGIRILGAFISTCTIFLAYNLLKKYLARTYLLVGLLMLSFYINEDAKNLYYNNFSAFLYLVACTFLFHGLRKNKSLLILLGGFFVGLNIFSRIPNVLGIGLVVAIIYSGYLQKESLRKILINSSIFLGGVILACLFVFLILSSLDQLKYFIGSIQMIFSPSRGAKDDGLNGAYGFTRLLSSNIIDYARSLRFVCIIGVAGLIIGYFNHLGQQAKRTVQVAIQLLNFALVLGVLILVFNGWFTSFRLMEFFVGMSLLSVLVLFDKKYTSENKLLAMLGLLVTLIHPFGSSEGISTVVVYSMWLSFPIALDYLSAFSLVKLDFSILTNAGESHVRTSVSRNALYSFKVVLLSVITLACLYNVIKFPYLCDRHNRWDMRYSVDNQFMHGIFTSKERVRDLNELLTASSKFMKPNDTVLAYDCMPMYHFMTQTRSYVRNPCIWFYTTDMFRKELDRAEVLTSHLPVIVRQLIKTTGDGSAWPDIRPKADYLQLPRNQGKNAILNEFISKNNYKEVWNNGDFTILVPPGK